MSPTCFMATHSPELAAFNALLDADPRHRHMHLVDMPFRAASTWRDRDCQVGLWKNESQLLAWAVFQPPWRNLDYAIAPSERGSALEQEVFAWGKQQMIAYAKHMGEPLHGAVELFEDTPRAQRTVEHLQALGFEQLDWSIPRFELDLRCEFPDYQLPAGFRIRPLNGQQEVQEYVDLVEAVFGPNWMTGEWRRRTIAHPAYRPEIDLIAANAQDVPVGFCGCWLWRDIGQIEPLGVHPEYRGLGLARALELAACAALQRQGARLLYVDHGSTNERAIALSLKTGFRQTNNALRYHIH
ncbi:MAG TPA: GNAT family N-acetyltransferase [Roseiflexaceae bacterium]|nr:GNAT family N-acetyltransferase [Roseiflexaceae bacterium]